MIKPPVSKLVFAFLFLTFFFILIFYSITYQSVRSTIESSKTDATVLVLMDNLKGLIEDLHVLEMTHSSPVTVADSSFIATLQKQEASIAVHVNLLSSIRTGDTLWQSSVKHISELFQDYSIFIHQHSGSFHHNHQGSNDAIAASKTSLSKLEVLHGTVLDVINKGQEYAQKSAKLKAASALHADRLFRSFGLVVLISLLLLYFRISYDLRKRAELEAKLHAFNDALSKHVNQKTAELRDKNEQLNLFLEHSPAALAMFDTEMNYLVVSKQWSEDFNLGSESLIGKCHYDVFPAMKQWWKDLHARAMNGEAIRGSEDSFVSNEGKLEWKRWDVYPWHEVTGKIGGIIIFSQIITEEKKAKDRLMVHDALLSRSEQMGKFGCWETDFLIDRTECSDAYYSLTGLPKEEQTSLSKFRALIHPKDREQFEIDIKRIYKQPGTYNHNFRIIATNGETKSIHSSLEIYYSTDGKLLRAFGVMQDVTEQEKYEEALRESEEKYRMLFDQADDGIVLSTQDGSFLEANPAFHKLVGYTTEELSSLRIENILHIAESEEPLRYKQLLKHEKVDSIRTAIRKDGSKILISVNAKMMPNGLFLGFARDITEKVESARALMESENKFRAIFESEPECVKLMDIDCNLLSMNPSGLIMLGATSMEELKDHCVTDIVHPKYREAYKRMAKKVFAGEIVSLDFEITTLRGDHRILESQCIPLKNAAGEVTAVLSVSIDITEKKKAENRLAASEARFRSIIEQFPFPVASYNTRGDMFSLNKSWEILWQSKKEDFEGYNILKDPLVVEAGLMEATHRAFKGEVLSTPAFHYEPSRIGTSGRSRWIIPTLFPLKTDSGEIIEIIEILQDVTDQIEAKEELEKSEEKYRTLVEEANDGIFIADKAGNFVVVNPSGCKMSQYTFEELKNMTLYDLVLKEELEKRPFRFAEMHEGKVVHSERKMVRKDGKLIDVELSAKFISETRFLCFIRDVTEAKKAQNEIKKSNDRFNLIANATNDALYEWDLDTNVIWWSESHFLMFGFDPRKPIPSQEEWLTKIHPDDRHLLIEQLENTLSRKITNASAIIRYITADGSYGTLLQRCTQTNTEISHQGTVVGSFVDITSRMKIEEELRLKEKAIATSISGMGMTDLRGFITYANETLWKMWGFSSSEELIGKHLTDVFYGDRIQVTMKNLQEKGYDHGEDLGLKADGKIMNIAFSANIITDQKGEPICLFGSFLDITDRKKAEDAIRLSESKYRLLFDLSPLPKFVFDEKTFEILDVNNATSEHYGYSREELLSMVVENILTPEDGKIFARSIISGSVSKKAGLWNHITKTGKAIQVEIFTHKLLYNSRPAWLVLANDVTKEIEQKVLLEQTTAQLRQLAAHLQDIREEERTNIAREIHDEMGQQLTALKIDLSYIKKKCDPTDATTMARVEAAMGQVDDTIKSIRRISTDLHPGILEDLGLVAALEWQAQEFEIRTGIKTEFIDRSSDKSIDKGISRAIFRIFQESLTNIARHSYAKNAKSILEIDKNELRLLITDDGKGFDISELKHSKSLGLVGIKERVILMNGRYSIDSKPGKGTEIKVSVPLANIQSPSN